MQRFYLAHIFIFIGLSCLGSNQNGKQVEVGCTEDSSRIKIKRLSINSDQADFSPLLVNNSLMLFVSSRPDKTGMYYTNELNTDITDLFYSEKRDSVTFGKPRPFSKIINSKYNEGPFTLSNDGNTIYFSGNSKNAEGSKKMPERLQIYVSHKTGKEWTPPVIAPFCDASYSSCHPVLSKDNRLLVFCSDMPGGFGGTDLYCTRFQNGEWSKPVNLGASINSASNEVFPFLQGNSLLYFSSNRSTGLGGLDIYSVNLQDPESVKPIHIESPINTASDDFGVWVDSLGKSGYFSSNRFKEKDDLYYFSMAYPDFTNASAPPVKTKFCYSFFQENANEPNDSVSMTYEWDFGNGHKIRAEKCRYCFDKPGDYPIQLNVVEKNSGEVFYNQTTYTLTIEEPPRLFIPCSDTETVFKEVVLNAHKSEIKGYRLLEYYWSFGDGTYNVGQLTKHVYKKRGVYTIELGVVAKNETTQLLEKFKIDKAVFIKERAMTYEKQ